MAMSYQNFLKALEKDARDFMKNQGQAFSKIATQKLMKEAENQMKRFYNDYLPDVYVRTYNLYNHSYFPISVSEQHKGNTYYGGINIGSSRMYDYYSTQFSKEYRDPITGMWNPLKEQKNPITDVSSPIKDVVAYSSQVFGWHGPKKGDKLPKKITLPTPSQELYSAINRITKEALEEAQRSAQGKTYRLKYSFN